MTIVRAIDLITEWLNEVVCPQIEMKMPPASAQPTDVNYDYTMINPVAFPLFLPSKEKLPQGVEAQIPSICVQLLEGEDNGDTQRVMTINLGFSGWNPGIHPKDWIYPTEDTSEDVTDYYTSADGWRALWNFVDITVREIEAANDLNGIQIVKEEPVDFGPYKEQENIPDYYPFWFAYATFKVRMPIMRKNMELVDLL